MRVAPFLVPRTRLTITGLLFILSFLCAANPSREQSGTELPVRMAIFSTSPEVSDRVAAELSQDPHFVVIERAQIEGLLQEGALSRASKYEDTRVMLGRLLEVEVVVHVQIAQKGCWRVDIVQGTSGKLLASEGCAGDASKAAQAARALVKTIPRSNSEKRRRIVVNDFRLSTENNPTQSSEVGGRLAAELRTRLLENGLLVLDRLSITQVASEQILAEIGLTELAGKPLPPLLGADWVVAGEYSPAGNALRLSILDIANGRVLRQETFKLFSGDGSAGISENVMKWVLGGVVGEAVAQKFAELQRDPKAWVSKNLNPLDYETKTTIDWSKWVPRQD